MKTKISPIQIQERKKEACFLAKDEIHVYAVPLLDYGKKLNSLSLVLSETELKRAEQFKFFKDQCLFIASRGILRHLLSSYLNTAPKDIEITYGPWGKPYLKKTPLYFNLSHSKDYALYAFTRHYEVGIDLEYIEEDFYSEDMGLDVFSEKEKEYLKDMDINNKNHTFYNMWAAKEAMLKASGKGWMENKKNQELTNINLLYRTTIKDFENLEISYPFCFECISGYTSSVFVKGPPLFLRYFSFEEEGIEAFKNWP